MIRLVIVDDNAGLQSFLEEYFKDNEEVEILYQAGNGEDGLRFIERNKDNIDVILLDLIINSPIARFSDPIKLALIASVLPA